MDIETYRTHCLKKPGVSESFPFDPYTLVYKVGGKIFTLANIENFERINVKCAPEKAIALRNKYPGIIPAWHMNKKHWNTIYLEGFGQEVLKGWIDHAYERVVAQMPLKKREALGFVSG